MKKLAFVFCSILFFYGCNNSVPEPKNLIDEDKMIDILYDISVLEAIKSTNPLSLENRAINPKTYIYTKYKIDSLQFANSDKFYASDIKNYQKMYKKVIEKIDAIKKSDSLKALKSKIKK